MPRRSRMAVLALVWIACACIAGMPNASASEPITNDILLQLQISGLDAEGCVLEIKPAHAGCQFEPLALKIDGYTASRTVRLEPILINAISHSADRDCTFAITVWEKGQVKRTVSRGLRLMPATAEAATPRQTLRVFLSTPSLAARADTTVRR